MLANLETPVVIAKVDADKYRKLGNKYDIEYGTITFFKIFSYIDLHIKIVKWTYFSISGYVYGNHFKFNIFINFYDAVDFQL